ncbi:MAG: class I SAM-dependent methyltransferase [Opitutaceae bacterium]|jgi:ubiquinone/menaquinone biosynthesis C-methylase UbiE
MSAPHRFDRLARIYRPLEYGAFGRDLERARFCFLKKLWDCRAILVLGEGDGRCLEQLVRAAPEAHIDCLDLSPAMLARAEARLPADARSRVAFRQADLLTAALPDKKYDAVVTLFFLDCFTAEQTADMVRRIAASLRPGARWLWADFARPPLGLARLRAQAWLAVLYAFFRWQTSLSARVLPPAEALIVAAGFSSEAERVFQWGLVRSVLFCQPGAHPRS